MQKCKPWAKQGLSLACISSLPPSLPPSLSQIPERLMLTLELLKKELAIATLQQKLGKEVTGWAWQWVWHDTCA